MSDWARFPYGASPDGLEGLAFLPVTFRTNRTISTLPMLLDSGSTVNVLSYEAGLSLGLEWDRERVAVTLTGNLARAEAKGVLLIASVGTLPSVHLVFAWTRAEGVRSILGQESFFQQFDVCFYGSRKLVEVRLRSQLPERTSNG